MPRRQSKRPCGTPPGSHAIRGALSASKSVSRVLCSAAICLGAPLPARSSRLLGTAGPALRPSTALLRIEFTAPFRLRTMGELLPRLSTLTRAGRGRYISVALVLGSPPAGVTRYPCPMEPGLSSRTRFRAVPAAARLTRPVIVSFSRALVNRNRANGGKKRPAVRAAFRIHSDVWDMERERPPLSRGRIGRGDNLPRGALVNRRPMPTPPCKCEW